jgi:spermidine/putrescine transport system substrate-binding protein
MVAVSVLCVLIGVVIGYYLMPLKIVEEKKLPFEGQELVVGVWSGPYENLFTNTFIVPFEEETGAQIQVIPHWGYIPQLLAAPPGEPPLDITMVTLDEAIRGIVHQLWLPIRYENVPNAQDIWPNLWEAAGEDVKPYAVPFDVGAMVLMYRKDLVNFTITSWDDLWNPELKELIALEDCDWPQPAVYIGALLCKEESGAQEIYTNDGLDAVYQTLANMSRNLKFWYKSGADFVSALKTGEVVIGSYWHGTALAVSREDPRIGVTLPTETAAYFDLFCITNGTKKRDLAEAFLNYILSSSAQSRFIEIHGNFMSNKKVSLPLYEKDIFDLYPKTEEDWARIHVMDDRYIVPIYDQLYERLQMEVFPLAGS